MIEKRIIGVFESVEHIAVSIAVIISPWLADLVVAGLAVRNVQQILGWPLWLCVAVGAGLEGLGMATAGVALELRRYNATRQPDDPPAPVTLAWALVWMQFAGSVVLALLNTISGLVIWAIVAIPVLGGGGTLAQMLHDDHKKRLADQEARRVAAEHRSELERRRSERQAAKAERSAEQPHRSVSVPNIPEQRSERSELTTEQARVLAWYSEHPDASFQTAAEALELSKTRVWTRVKELAAAGVIRHNGHVEVL